MTSDPDPEQLIDRARGGDADALGRLLELYRNYLRLVARSLIGVALRVKLEPSDLVQETFLKAHREFAQFAGRMSPSWSPGSPHPGRGAWPTRSSTTAGRLATSSGRNRWSSCSNARTRRSSRPGRALRLAQRGGQPARAGGAAGRRRDRLPADYREVFVLRTLEHVPFEEIAARMGRSVGAVRMLWTRAVKTLNEMLEDDA